MLRRAMVRRLWLHLVVGVRVRVNRHPVLVLRRGQVVVVRSLDELCHRV